MRTAPSRFPILIPTVMVGVETVAEVSCSLPLAQKSHNPILLAPWLDNIKSKIMSGEYQQSQQASGSTGVTCLVISLQLCTPIYMPRPVSLVGGNEKMHACGLLSWSIWLSLCWCYLNTVVRMGSWHYIVLLFFTLHLHRKDLSVQAGLLLFLLFFFFNDKLQSRHAHDWKIKVLRAWLEKTKIVSIFSHLLVALLVFVFSSAVLVGGQLRDQHRWRSCFFSHLSVCLASLPSGGMPPMPAS